MSISDMIVVMRNGKIQQVGKPQTVYDSPANLFVAKFLGTPPISVFEGSVKGEKLYIGDSAVMDAPGVRDGQVWAAVRPEGFVPKNDGPLEYAFSAVEVMGRDISVVCSHPSCEATSIRAIISAETFVDGTAKTIRFALKPNKTFIFDRVSEERLEVGVK